MPKKDAAQVPFEERKHLASQVRQLRQGAGMKQQDLADLVGISRQALSNIERGATPQIENLRKIYEALGADLHASEHTTDTDLWLEIIGGMLDTLDQPRQGKAGQAAVNAIAAVIAEPRVGGLIENEDSRLRSDYALAAHEEIDETGEDIY
ncbi:helix-turn-helix transcriptional regulator [Leucobacter coleopterorum]|uniref:Helix-turn-helix transcriptional regulator n=1 Tax=Leucobacter coleopterorum TaxID=2714933 RepID=A0ABX6K2P6_9MICO|nr:helix-turn-helix transcriptional regulator [Leucobacter coleopterorum]QIM19474.1 helix-turn-helix transcriptional regulator [Leucobacter coleopterorum]